MRSTMRTTLPLLALVPLAFGQKSAEDYNTPAGESACGIDLKNKGIPATGECSVAGGIFSIGFPVELMTYLSTKGIAMGSGKEQPPLFGAASGPSKGTGPYPASYKTDPTLPGHTIYAPEKAPDFEMPFLTWGNGGCGTSPHGSGGAFGNGYDGLLTEIASHGFIIAADGPGLKTAQSNVKDMLASIKWAKEGNAQKYGKVDLKKIATMGHSCGGLEGMSASYHNPDVALTLMFNIATFHDDKRYLIKELKAPIAWFVGNPSDMGYENSRRDYGNLTAGLPAYWASLDTGHQGTYGAPNGGKFAKAAAEFLKWQFRGDAKAKEYCMGAGIKADNWKVESKNWK